jgi:hypothetical protein
LTLLSQGIQAAQTIASEIRLAILRSVPLDRLVQADVSSLNKEDVFQLHDTLRIDPPAA